MCRDNSGKHKEKRHLEDTVIDDTITIKRSSSVKIEWVKVAQDRWRVVDRVIQR